jgi:hypothetical protein
MDGWPRSSVRQGLHIVLFTGVCLIDEISVLGLGQPHVAAYNAEHTHSTQTRLRLRVKRTVASQRRKSFLVSLDKGEMIHIAVRYHLRLAPITAQSWPGTG